MGLFNWLFGKKEPGVKTTSAKESTSSNIGHQVAHQEEWLMQKKSGIAHRYYIHPNLNPQYRFSICGHQTAANKLTSVNSETKYCSKCQRSKGW
jgi:hypothetical protein